MPSVKVNPEILVWARETAGLTLQQAVGKINIGDSRNLTAVDKLTALECGETDPTRAQLVKMAKHYRRPLLTFYLPKIPQIGNRGVDFRTLSLTQPNRMNPLIDALIRNVQSRQSMVRALLEAEDEAETLNFVGSLKELAGESDSMGHSLRRAVTALHQVLDLELPTQYYQKRNSRKAFDLLRSRAEAAGVFVLLKGHLGSHHTDFRVDDFRGFVIADNIAPFVIINYRDATPAWSFSLLHELVHLLLGETGISGGNLTKSSEVFCNTVASECLLPEEELEQLHIEPNPDITEQAISAFAATRNLSRTLVAYRLLHSDRIDQPFFSLLCENFANQWQQSKDKQRESARASKKNSPVYYPTQSRNVGAALTSLTKRMIKSGALSTTKAAKILDVKPANVGTLLNIA